MGLSGMLVTVLIIIVILLLAYLVLIVVERLFGPIDSTVKSVIGIIVLLCVLIYLLSHLGVLSFR